MTSAISHTSVDCRDAFAQAQWWKQVVGHVDDPDDPDQPGDPMCWIQAVGGGQPLLFAEVAEGKAVKNQLHLDLVPPTGPRRGVRPRPRARSNPDRRPPRQAQPRDRAGRARRPEGNELCVLRSRRELAVTGR